MNIIIEEIVSEFPVIITEEIVQIEISETVSNFNVIISDSVSYFDIKEVSDIDFVNKDGYVPTVDEATGKIILKELPPPSGTPSGTAGGDLGGTYPNPTVPALADKVDKVPGKSLISDTEIARLASVDNFDNSGNVAALSNKADLVGGVVPSAQLPSFVDDVLEFANLASFPVTGESGKIYLAIDVNKSYRWSGSTYVHLDDSIALGETSATAYRGDRGKIAYDHSQDTTTNPHNVTKSQVGLGNVPNLDTSTTSNVTEGTRLYFTVARVLATLLSGLSASSGTFTSSNTILEAFGKLQYFLDTTLPTLATIAYVNTSVDDRPKIIHAKSGGSFGTPSTGNTTENVLIALPITGGEFVNSDAMRIAIRLAKNGTVGNIQLRVRAGTTGTTADSQLALATGPTGNNSTVLLINRFLIEFGSGNTITSSFGITQSSSTDLAVGATGSRVSASVNYGSNWFLTLTAQSTSSTEIVTLGAYTIEKLKNK